MQELEPRVPQPGVEFIYDYYAILGVDPNSDVETIEDAWRDKIKLYHPDRYQSLAPEFRVDAETLSKVINLARGVLADRYMRAAYNIRFAQWKGPISIDGRNPSNFEMLTSGQRISIRDDDFDEKLDSWLKDNLMGTDFDPQMFEFIEGQYNSSANPSEAVKSLYRKVLLQKNLFLREEQGIRLMFIGVNNYQAITRDIGLEHQREVSEWLSVWRNNLEDELDPDTGGMESAIRIDAEKDPVLFESFVMMLTEEEKILPLLNSPDLLFLPGGDNNLPASNTAESDRDNSNIGDLVNNGGEERSPEFYLNRFDSQAKIIMELAGEREETVRKVLNFVSYEYFPADNESRDKFIIQLELGGQQTLVKSTLGEDGEFSFEEFAKTGDVEDSLLSAEYKQNGYGFIRFKHEDGLSLRTEINQVLGSIQSS